MSRQLKLLSMVLASGSLCLGAEVELTGLVDMGSCRMACVRLKANSELLSLRTGERAGDLIFEEMDSRAGWAEFRQGTNQVRIWLHSYCASAAATPVESSRALKRQQALKRSGEAAAND